MQFDLTIERSTLGMRNHNHRSTPQVLNVENVTVRSILTIIEEKKELRHKRESIYVITQKMYHLLHPNDIYTSIVARDSFTCN